MANAKIILSMLCGPCAIERRTKYLSWLLFYVKQNRQDKDKLVFVKLLLVVLSKEEDDEDVLLSLLNGFGHLGAKGCVHEIAALKEHPQADVRLALIHAIMYEGSSLAIKALIFLSRDPNSEVRDWATFSLGAQSRLTNKALRKALAERLNDISADVRFETICGLAERHDERAI